jgi:hypothetical protein
VCASSFRIIRQRFIVYWLFLLLLVLSCHHQSDRPCLPPL